METTKQQIETLKANSFQGRYGGVGTDFKLYFDTLEELKTCIDTVVAGRNYLAAQLGNGTITKD